MTEPELDNRRPLKSRQLGWVGATAAMLARTGITPNQISGASMAFAALAAALLGVAPLLGPGGRAACLIGAAACVQLRLLCNLFDGMVAVEHGLSSPTGAIWNELPDRISDLLFLAAAGHFATASGWPVGIALGWGAAALAILTAYVRELGRAVGQPADFSGPMAKPQRMAVLTGACVLSAFEPLWGTSGLVMVAALALIALGAALTTARRTATLARRLKAAA
jgi:phosphatidylglycerophosphate synthase